MGTFDCGDLDCLRARPVAAFAKEYPKFGSATYGVPSLPVAPAEAIRGGAGMPVLAGSNRHEHRLTAGIFAVAGWRISAAEYPGLITKAFGARAPAILREYPIAASGGDGAVAWADVFTDSMACASGQDEPATFQYLFADENAQPFVELPADYPAGASHGSELMHLFDMAGRKPLSSDRYTDAQRDLAATMIDYWTAFARTGDPNHEGARTWPKGGTLRLKPGAIGPVDVAKIHRCDFWRSLD
jgi:para-nitrobenzyl esterase